MDAGAYAVEAEVEQTHWWFVGRRRLFAQELEKSAIPSTASVLDIGTSTGTNLRMLRELGFRNVVGLDRSDDAIRFCASKGLGPVEKGDILAMPFVDNAFDLVLATDIIEHVDDDSRALREIARVLAPTGKVLITVPAFNAVWGLQDEVAHHKRRYRLRQLLTRIEAAGLDPTRRYYFNYLLFGPIWLARRLMRLMSIRVDSEGQINTPMLNKLLSLLFAFDLKTAPLLRPPLGVSILVMAEKRRGA